MLENFFWPRAANISSNVTVLKIPFKLQPGNTKCCILWLLLIAAKILMIIAGFNADKSIPGDHTPLPVLKSTLRISAVASQLQNLSISSSV